MGRAIDDRPCNVQGLLLVSSSDPTTNVASSSSFSMIFLIMTVRLAVRELTEQRTAGSSP